MTYTAFGKEIVSVELQNSFPYATGGCVGGRLWGARWRFNSLKYSALRIVSIACLLGTAFDMMYARQV